MSKTSWNRLKQVTRETLAVSSKDTKTDIPNDIHTMMLKAEGVENLFGDLLEQAARPFPEHKVTTKNADDPVKEQPYYQLVHSFESMATHYQSDQMTREFLGIAANTMSALAREKAALDSQVHQTYFQPKRALMQDHIDEAAKRFDKLKQRRVDLDAQKHKLKTERKQDEPTKMKKYELEVQTAQQRFDNELGSIRELLTPVVDEHQVGQSQCAQTASMLQAMKDYFARSYEILCQLDAKVNLAQVEQTASVGGARSRPMPPSAPMIITPRKSTETLRNNSDRMEFAQPAVLVNQSLQPRLKVPPPVQPRKGNNNNNTNINTMNTSKTMVQVMLPPDNNNAHNSNLRSVVTHQPSAPSIMMMSGAPPKVTAPKPKLAAPPVRNNNNMTTNRCTALYDFAGEQPGDISMQAGDELEIVSSAGEWWVGICLRTGERGNFPGNYVKRN